MFVKGVVTLFFYFAIVLVKEKALVQVPVTTFVARPDVLTVVEHDTTRVRQTQLACAWARYYVFCIDFRVLKQFGWSFRFFEHPRPSKNEVEML